MATYQIEWKADYRQLPFIHRFRRFPQILDCELRTDNCFLIHRNVIASLARQSADFRSPASARLSSSFDPDFGELSRTEALDGPKSGRNQDAPEQRITRITPMGWACDSLLLQNQRTPKEVSFLRGQESRMVSRKKRKKPALSEVEWGEKGV